MTESLLTPTLQSREGCWEFEFTDDQRRIICQRIIVRMVGELFKPEETPNDRSSKMH
jgi:hypothetical protein